jgi:hypothetical protein
MVDDYEELKTKIGQEEKASSTLNTTKENK